MSERADNIMKQLGLEHPDAHCELNYGSDFQLLVAVILSAQCTDKRVNLVTKELFGQLKTPFDFAAVSQEKLEELIRPCGFFRSKARSIISASTDIIERFGGNVPRTMEELLTLRGVGRKTANVMLSVAFGESAIAVDTHVFRLAHRLGLSDKPTPEGVERDLMNEIDEDLRSKAHHLLIFHGRYVCHSRNPECDKCGVTEYCEYIRKK